MCIEMQMMTSKCSYSAYKPSKYVLIVCITLWAGLGFHQSASSYVVQGSSTKNSALQNKPSTAPATPPQVAKDLPRADFIQLMDAEFRKRDLDSNGKATRIEVEEFTKRAAAAKAQEQNRALFQRLDSDRNGMLSPAEFAALVPPPKFIDVSAEMIRFDSNRDQIITLVEYRTATLANFDRMDADKDGILSASELAKMNTSPTNEPSDR